MAFARPNGAVEGRPSPAEAKGARRRYGAAAPDALLEVTGGDLKDDATVLCLDWHGGPPRRRTSDGGANLHQE